MQLFKGELVNLSFTPAPLLECPPKVLTVGWYFVHLNHDVSRHFDEYCNWYNSESVPAPFCFHPVRLSSGSQGPTGVQNT